MAAGNPFIPAAPPVQDPLQQYGRLVALRQAVQQQRLMGQQMQENALNIQKGQMDIARTQALNDAFAGAVSTDPNTGQPTFDRQKVIQSVANSGQGAAIPELNQSFLQLDKLAGEVQQTRDAHNTAALNYMGALGREVQQRNYDPAAMGIALAHATSAGYGQEANAIRQRLNQNPDQLKQLVDEIVAGAPQQAEVFKNVQQGNLAAAETAQKQPFTPDKIAQLNAGMAQGWQVLHPGQPLPTAYQLGPNSTQADFQRLDSLMKNESSMAATQAQRNVANQMRQQMTQFSQGMAQERQAQQSYQYSSTALDKVGQPIEQLVQRMSRLKDTLAQNNPQADALVAPELLTVMAGGQGSGLRMNEAEISRIVGGRNKWQALKSAIDQWQADPTKPFLITPVQRQQIGALLDEVNSKLEAKQNVLDDARADLANSDDPREHRQILTRARNRLMQVDQGKGSGQGGQLSPAAQAFISKYSK